MANRAYKHLNCKIDKSVSDKLEYDRLLICTVKSLT